MAHLERVVVLVDMDCFYCQVEEKLNPDLKGLPIAVVQYNAWRGGGIIAVNYVAREKGVTRHMRGDEAQAKCPEIVLCRVPNVRGKADLTKYREGGKDVANILQKFTPLLQRASIDEAYLDITEVVLERIQQLQVEVSPSQLSSTHIYGCLMEDFLYNLYNDNINNDSHLRLIVGAVIVEEIRAAVFTQTGYTCSAGIAHNKILAKLACGFNKPNKQTVLPHDNVPELYRDLPLKKIKSLGGKFGESLSEDLKITYMCELEQFSESFLRKKYDDKNGSWLYNIARGIDSEPVTPRFCPKSIGCCKRFPGQNNLLTITDVKHWTDELSQEVSERLHQELSENNREAKHMVVNFTLKIGGQAVTSSKSKNSCSYDAAKLSQDALDIIKKANPVTGSDFKYPITFLGVSAGKFTESHTKINNFFTKSNTQNSEQSGEASGKVEKAIQNTENNVSEKDETTGKTTREDVPPRKITEERTEEIHTMVFDASTTQHTDICISTEPAINNCTLLNFNGVEDDGKVCPDCGLKIALVEWDIHTDYHVALSVATSERISCSTKTKNEKMPDTRTVKNNVRTIESFIPKICDPIPSSETDFEICAQCQQKIEVSKFLEHLDYHEAKKLSVEINGCAQKTTEVCSKVLKSENLTNSVKQKRPAVDHLKKTGKKPKTITSFFKPA